MRLLLALAALLGLASPAAAQEAPAALPRVQAVLVAHPEIGAYLVARGNIVVATPSVRGRAVGSLLNVEPILQPWASVTKQVVAVMVMQQVEAGRLSLEAPADRYLPQLRGTTRPPTIRELLQHRSGLWNPDDSPPGADGMPSWYAATGDPFAPCLIGRTAPGGNWRYNNCDYLALGHILEQVTGKPLAQLFRDRIARPAGLSATRFASERDRAMVGAWREARPGRFRDWPDADQRLFTRFGAAGGLIGSMADLQRFDHALVHGQLLSAASVATLWRADPSLGYMALGQWVFDAQPHGCTAPLHIVERRGGIGRYQVRNIIIPALDLTIIMFVREENLDFGEIWQGRGLSHDVLAAAACG